MGMAFRFLNEVDYGPTKEANRSPKPFSFSLLPIELRWKIWELALPSQRLLSIIIIEATDATCTTHDKKYTSRNFLNNLVSGAGYRLLVETSSYLSPLLWVNRESRNVVQRHYRLRIPTNSADPYLVFRPESDIIHVEVEVGDEYLFADFVHDTQAYDPQGLGILNIGIGGNAGTQHTKLPQDPTTVCAHARKALETMLASLQSVTIIDIVKGDTRLMFSCLELQQPRYNRSIPFYSPTAAFELLPADPRNVGPDMDQVLVGHDPRCQLYLWRQMEAAFGSTRPCTEFRFMITAPPTIISAGNLNIRCMADAHRYVEAEAETWKGNFNGDGIYKEFGYENPDTEASLSRARNMPAVGFWLFPLNAFGEVQESEFEEAQRDSCVIADLSSFRPQLGLFQLSHTYVD